MDGDFDLDFDCDMGGSENAIEAWPVSCLLWIRAAPSGRIYLTIPNPGRCPGLFSVALSGLQEPTQVRAILGRPFRATPRGNRESFPGFPNDPASEAPEERTENGDMFQAPSAARQRVPVRVTAGGGDPTPERSHTQGEGASCSAGVSPASGSARKNENAGETPALRRIGLLGPRRGLSGGRLTSPARRGRRVWCRRRRVRGRRGGRGRGRRRRRRCGSGAGDPCRACLLPRARD